MHRHALTKVTPIGGHSVTFPCSNGEQVYYRDRTKCIDGARFQRPRVEPIACRPGNRSPIQHRFNANPDPICQSINNPPIPGQSAKFNPRPISQSSTDSRPICHQSNVNHSSIRQSVPNTYYRSMTNPPINCQSWSSSPIH